MIAMSYAFIPPPIAKITPNDLSTSFALYRPDITFCDLIHNKTIDSNNLYFTCPSLPGTNFIYLNQSRAWHTKIDRNVSFETMFAANNWKFKFMKQQRSAKNGFIIYDYKDDDGVCNTFGYDYRREEWHELGMDDGP